MDSKNEKSITDRKQTSSAIGKVIGLAAFIAVIIFAIRFLIKLVASVPALISSIPELPLIIQHGLLIVVAAAIHAVILRSAHRK